MATGLQKLSEGIRYRGREGQWAWILHRVTGVGVLLFLLIHIIDTFLITLGPSTYNHAMALYRLPVFRVGEVFLFASVLFHAINGVRIAIFDFWPAMMEYHREMVWIGVAVFVVLFLPAAWLMLEPVFF